MTDVGTPQVLVAPDSFKGTFTSEQIAASVASGLRLGGLAAREMPVADGGEGTLSVLTKPLHLKLETVAATDPLGTPIEAPIGLSDDGVAVIETASASGLTLIPPQRRDPIAASTLGTGQLIAHAINAGARQVYIAVGGSATTDGGAGALKALSLVDPSRLKRTRLTVLCDVRTEFERAAEIFAPQKGADASQVRQLTSRLRAQAEGFRRDPRGVAMTGAAGGLAGALWAQLGATLTPGAGTVLDLLEFDAELRRSVAVVTGEGRLDQQSLAGKLVSEVAARSARHGLPCHAVVGSRELSTFDARTLGLDRVIEAGDSTALEAAGRLIADAVKAAPVRAAESIWDRSRANRGRGL